VFENRRFVTGLGIGLIAGAALLQLMLTVDKATSRPVEPKTTPTVQQAQAEGPDRESTLQQGAEKEPSGTASGTEQSAQAPGQGTEPAQTSEVTVVRAVYISERMDAASVAELFAQAQIVPEAKPLLDALNERQLTGRIRSGYYTFKDSPAVFDIVDQITKPID
jgi:hypothetical protein